MARLEETQVKNDPVADWDDLGEQRGVGAAPPLPPGTYEFKLPQDLRDSWTPKFSTDRGERVAMKPMLTIVTARNPDLVGEQRAYRINGAERNRARRGEAERFVSDLQFFYRDGLLGTEKPKGIADLCRAIEKHGGAKFVADVEWSSYCNKKNVRWVVNQETGKSIEDPEKKFGCGNNYYQKDLPRNGDGTYAERFTCSCGASLKSFDGLTAFRPAIGEQA